jgi:hypothetical protein
MFTVAYCTFQVWPSLSADTLRRLHTMLLEQPHPTVQHKELLAIHFGVERKHVENFIQWRVACLHTEDGHPSREDVQQGHKTLPPIVTDEGVMDTKEATDPHAHLPTPAGTISPEPVHRRTSFILHADRHSPSVDTSPLSPDKFGSSGWPPSPSPVSTHLPSPPPHDQRPSHAKHAQVSPPSPPGPQNVPSEDPRPTRQDDRLHALTNAAAPKMPAQAPAAPSADPPYAARVRRSVRADLREDRTIPAESRTWPLRAHRAHARNVKSDPALNGTRPAGRRLGSFCPAGFCFLDGSQLGKPVEVLSTAPVSYSAMVTMPNGESVPFIGT